MARVIHAEVIENATNSATLTVQTGFHSTILRPLQADDVEAFQQFIARQSKDRFEFFRPHKFDRAGLKRHLKSQQFLSFGLFEGALMIGYGLIRITPTRAAYIGSMVAQSHSGRGVGKLLARYLYWQAAQMGFEAYLTISDDNPASLRSHSPERTLEKVRKLDGKGYSLYRAPRTEADKTPPILSHFAETSSVAGSLDEA
jgi:GNAT superfamily N-acetyltransferase